MGGLYLTTAAAAEGLVVTLLLYLLFVACLVLFVVGLTTAFTGKKKGTDYRERRAKDLDMKR
jgi:hypothetical protein